jgi:hypothetical protein
MCTPSEGARGVLHVSSCTTSYLEAAGNCSPEINGGFVREDAIAMQPGSGNDDVAPALDLAEEGGVLVEQR